MNEMLGLTEEELGLSAVEKHNNGAEIETSVGQFFSKINPDGSAEIFSDNEVTFQPNQEINFQLDIEKQPTPVDSETIINRILIDAENFGETMQNMLFEARELRDLPEAERIEPLLQILLGKVRYAYKDYIKDLPEEEIEWISQNIHKDFSMVKLSEVVEHGFGVCRHLSVLLLVLAKEAGLDGSYCTHHEFRNIHRKPTDYQPNDNRPALFRNANIEQELDEWHAFTEIKIHDGDTARWIPVDPSTQLIGNNAERLATFTDAGYCIKPAFGFDAKLSSDAHEIPSTLTPRINETRIPVGVNNCSINLKVANTETEYLVFGKGMTMLQPEPYSGDLKIEISPVHHHDYYLKVDAVA